MSGANTVSDTMGKILIVKGTVDHINQLPLPLSSVGRGGLDQLSSIRVVAVVTLGMADTFYRYIVWQGCL